jgi:hypothetical protein
MTKQEMMDDLIDRIDSGEFDDSIESYIKEDMAKREKQKAFIHTDAFSRNFKELKAYLVENVRRFSKSTNFFMKLF